MSAISIENLEKTYPNGHHALKGISIDIEQGEFLVLVGPSGCGKSTLLRTIAGLESVSSGTLKIGEQKVENIAPAKRDIAMVFQNYALYPHMTVYNNMAYGLKNRGIDKKTIEQKVNHAAKLLKLESYLGRKPNQLSGGQRQRVAMGRAIVRDPKAFLFDEPLSNLDAKLRIQMRNEIKQLQKSLNTTSVYVTHDQTEAMTLADRLAVINNGVIEQIGKPIDLYDKPASVFVASFIGSPTMNFFSGFINNNTLEIGATTITLSMSTGFSGPVTVGIRPEHFYRQGEQTHSFKYSVNFQEPLGADTLLYGQIEGCQESTMIRINRFYPDNAPREFSIYIKEEELHLFNEKTGKRIN